MIECGGLLLLSLGIIQWKKAPLSEQTNVDIYKISHLLNIFDVRVLRSTM